MTIEEIDQELNRRGMRIDQTRSNRSGLSVYLVVKPRDWDLAMFHADLADLLQGRATRQQIIERNRAAGADLADWEDGWPVPDRAN
jgi:hypothetical protein